MPTVVTTPFGGTGSILGTGAIDPGPSGEGLIFLSPLAEPVGYGGGAGSVSVPGLSVEGVGSVSNSGTGVVAVDNMEVDGVGGAVARVAFENWSTQAAGTVLAGGRGQVVYDGAVVQATGAQHIRPTLVDVSFPVIRVDASGYQSNAGNAEVFITGISVSGSGLRGAIGDALIEMALGDILAVDGDGYLEATGQGQVLFPIDIVVLGGARRPDYFAGLILRFEDEYQP